MKKERRQLYGGRIPAGYKLAHNIVARTANMPHGMNGFRRFWIPPEWTKWHWVKCRCGWRPDLGAHYRGRGTDEMLLTMEEMDEWMGAGDFNAQHARFKAIVRRKLRARRRNGA